MINLNILRKVGNIAVVDRSDREHPGLLIQGDSLKVLLDGLEEVVEELDNNNTESAKSITMLLVEQLTGYLSSYEVVLDENNIAIPYNKHSA